MIKIKPYIAALLVSTNVVAAPNYTPIDPNFELIPAKESKNWTFVGINLAGLEFGKTIEPYVIPDLSLANSQSNNSDLNDTQSFINQGVNTIRLPLSWSYLQREGAGVGGIDKDYYESFVRPQLQTLTHAKVHTIIDLHSYMHYPKYGQDYSGQGQLILDENAYISVWSQLWDLVAQDNLIDKDYILLDLMNEPYQVPDDKVFTIQTALIKMLREKGFNGNILVEGNTWTGLHSWVTGHWYGNDGKAYSNASLFTAENFHKAGIDDLSNIIINVHQYLDGDYSGTQDNCQQDLTTTGDQGFNLDAFINYLKENKMKAFLSEFGTSQYSQNCQQPLRQLMQYMQTNSTINHPEYGFVGWTIWSTGHGWGGYNYRVLPNSYQMDILKEFL